MKEVEQKLEKNGRGKRRQTSGGKGREESREKKKYEENIEVLTGLRRFVAATYVSPPHVAATCRLVRTVLKSMKSD